MIKKLTPTATFLAWPLLSTLSFTYEKPIRVHEKIEHEKHRIEKEKQFKI